MSGVSSVTSTVAQGEVWEVVGDWCELGGEDGTSAPVRVDGTVEVDPGEKGSAGVTVSRTSGTVCPSVL